MASLLIKAARAGNTGWVAQLLASGMDPTQGDNRAVRVAAEEGHACVIQLLARDPRVDLSAAGNAAAYAAGRGRHSAALRVLLRHRRVRTTLGRRASLCLAAQAGLVAEVRALFQGPHFVNHATALAALDAALWGGSMSVLAVLCSYPCVPVRPCHVQQVNVNRWRAAAMCRLLQGCLRWRARAAWIRAGACPMQR
jgi:hypothetical protein